MPAPPTLSRSSSLLLRLSPVLYLTHRVAAYSWSFQEAPKQCTNLTISITGSDGVPPYHVLIIPYGPSPLANNVEARTVLDVPFNGTSLNFQLKYPENSQFVAVVSDASAFGSGGTSATVQVASSNDASCFDAKTNVAPAFYFSIEPANQIVTCASTRLWWDPATVQGTTNFQGVIPGGQSFAIPHPNDTQVANQGTGFSWKANLRSGTTLMIVGGDNRGNGSAGSSLNVVSAGIAPDLTCLDSSSPSSTAGSPAGGSYPTSSSGTSGGGGSSGGNNTGAIVGGVVGGLVAIIALFLTLYFLRRRSRDRRHNREKQPLDLLNAEDEDGDDHDDGHNRHSRNELPQFYQPEPFTVPDPTTGGSTYEDESISGGRRPTSVGTSTSFYTDGSQAFGYGAAAGGSSTGGRKGAPPRMMRPVNIIQHDDAGPSGPKEEETETIELPPAYTALRKDEAPPPPASPPPPHEAAGSATATAAG